MTALRLSRIALTASLAAFFSLIAFGNITDYGTNFAFVQHVMSMDTTFRSPGVMWRAVTAPWAHHAAYAAIIAWQVGTAALLWFGVSAPDEPERPYCWLSYPNEVAPGGLRDEDAVGRLTRSGHGLVVVPSPSAAEILADRAHWPQPRELAALTPERSPQDVVDALAREVPASATAIALVGHEPALPRLASYLLTGSASTLSFDWRKGGVMRLLWTGHPFAGAASLVWFAPPRALRRLAG